MLASLPEIDNPGLVLPGLGPGSSGIMYLDTSLWEECGAAEASSQLNYAAAAAVPAAATSTSAPDHDCSCADVLPLDGSTNQRVQSRFNSYFEGLVAGNSGAIDVRAPFIASPFGAAHDTRVMSHEYDTVADPSAVMSSFSSSSAAHGRTRPDTSGYLGAMLPF